MDKTQQGAQSAPSFYGASDLAGVVYGEGYEGAAELLARRFNVPLIGQVLHRQITEPGYIFSVDGCGLSLCATGSKAPGPIRCDFVGGESRHRRLYGGGKSQTIAKAVGIKDKLRPSVVDLTAGLGGDGFVLASLGCQVILVERNPVVFTLLADGLSRARLAAEEDPELAKVVDRVELIEESGRDWLQRCGPDQAPDVIYLDPMFPEKKKNAQVKKAMQAFQSIVGSDDDADQLLPLALDVAKHRVVVKRPLHAPHLNNQEPGYSLKGKSVRFDIYPLKKLGS